MYITLTSYFPHPLPLSPCYLAFPISVLSQSSLNGSIDAQQVQCLNEDASHTIRDLLKGGGDKWLESDADEQLLLHIPVRLSTFRPS